MSDWQPTSIGQKPPPPPDAGASFMGAHGLCNPLVRWLLGKHPELLALAPKAMTARAVPPRCPDPECRRPMVFRSGAWVCYHHYRRLGDEPQAVVLAPVRVPHEVEIPPIVPMDAFGCPVDVLSRVNEALDIVYDDLENSGHPEWRVRPLELGGETRR